MCAWAWSCGPGFGIDPLEIGGEASRQWDRDDLRKFVGMPRADRRLQSRVALERRLDEHREFLGVLGLALPAVHRPAGGKDVDASGETLVDQRVREPAGAVAVGQVRDHKAGTGRLHAAIPAEARKSETVG